MRAGYRIGRNLRTPRAPGNSAAASRCRAVVCALTFPLRRPSAWGRRVARGAAGPMFLRIRLSIDERDTRARIHHIRTHRLCAHLVLKHGSIIMIRSVN